VEKPIAFAEWVSKLPDFETHSLLLGLVKGWRLAPFSAFRIIW
jgi:hypothetical protein